MKFPATVPNLNADVGPARTADWPAMFDEMTKMSDAVEDAEQARIAISNRQMRYQTHLWATNPNTWMPTGQKTLDDWGLELNGAGTTD